MSKKLKIVHILTILQKTNKDNPLTVNQIKSKLEDLLIFAERKSINSDINALREIFPIKLCKDNKKGFYMQQEEKFELFELKFLLDSVKNAKFLTQKSKDKLCEKILANISPTSKNILKKNIFTPKLAPCTPYAKFNLSDLLDAINENKKIKFTLINKYKTNVQEKKLFIVNPYKLILKNNHYYLVANIDKYDNFVNFRIDNIRDLIILDDAIKFIDSNLEECLNTQVYNFNGNKITLELFTYEHMLYTLKDEFGKDITIIPFKNDYKVILHTVDSPGLYFLLLQYADNIKILSPIHVKNKLIQKLNNILHLYN